MSLLPNSERPIEVLFYGSINLRRKILLDEIRSKNINLGTLFNSYGADRDEQIASSKLVIDIHKEDVGSLEIVRMHHLLNNGVAVLSEVSATTSIEARYLDLVLVADYPDLVETCVSIIKIQVNWLIYEEKFYRSIRNFPKPNSQKSFSKRFDTRLKILNQSVCKFFPSFAKISNRYQIQLVQDILTLEERHP